MKGVAFATLALVCLAFSLAIAIPQTVQASFHDAEYKPGHMLRSVDHAAAPHGSRRLTPASQKVIRAVAVGDHLVSRYV